MKTFEPAIKTDNHLEKFLTGSSFSNFEKFIYKKKSYIPNRLDLLETLLVNKIQFYILVVVITKILLMKKYLTLAICKLNLKKFAANVLG